MFYELYAMSLNFFKSTAREYLLLLSRIAVQYYSNFQLLIEEHDGPFPS